METKTKTARSIMEGVLERISTDYHLNKTDLLKYLDGEPELNNISLPKKNTGATICRARKQDGQRCTRRCKDDSQFCGKHIKHQKFGCVQDTSCSDTITTDELYYNEMKYLVDDNDIVYLERDINGNDNYEIVGKRMKNGKIYFLKELIEKNLLKPEPTKSVDIQHMFPSVDQKMLTVNC